MLQFVPTTLYADSYNISKEYTFFTYTKKGNLNENESME